MWNTLPKVALHDHLDGGLRPSTLVDLAKLEGRLLPSFVPEELASIITEKANSKSLPGYLETFAWTLAVMQKQEHLVRIAREAVIDLAEDGVVLAELRFGPTLCTLEGLTVDAVIEAVTQGVREGRESVGNRIEVGLLLCGLRHVDEFSIIREAFLRHYQKRGSLVVGVDLAGPEQGYPPSNHPAIQQLAGELVDAPITLHAGEADSLISINEALRYGARRIGHGVRLQDSLAGFKPEIAEHMRNQSIAIEICLTSNLHTGTIEKFEDHPIARFVEYGIPVVPCTDNRLMSATTHSLEISRLADTFGFSEQDFLRMWVSGVNASFLPYSARQRAMRYF